MKKVIIACMCIWPAISMAQLTDSTQRLVKLQGAINFRDVGGYRTTDGRMVKWGKVFRSADISKLTDSDLQVLNNKHIATVIDFRGVEESKAAPDRLAPGTDYTLCPAGSDSASLNMRAIMEGKAGKDFLLGFYARTAPLGERYKPFFQKLLALNGDDALLFHCTGGRDRTGIGAALFLYALGVPFEKILEDYEASNVYLAPGNMYKKMAGQLQMNEADVEAMFKLRPELLNATFNALRQQYGSIESFMEKELGMDKKAIAQLRIKYTVQG